MTLVEVKEWKWAECGNCAAIFKIVKWIPVKHAACKSCSSLKIRRYYPEKETKRLKRC